MIRFKFWLDYYRVQIIEVLKLILILIGMSMIYQIPYFLRVIQLKYYDSETIGQIISIEKIIGLNQTEGGGKVAVNGYDIKYRYEVDKQGFINIETINIRSLETKELINLNRLVRGDFVKIKYQLNEPDESIIVIEDNRTKK